jgi:tight adherence protein C
MPPVGTQVEVESLVGLGNGLASFLVGAALASFGYWLMAIVTADRGDGDRWATFETERRRALRQANSVYRWFEPLVDALAERWAGRRPGMLRAIEQDLNTVADELRWTAPEWLAVCRLTAWGWALGIGLDLGWLCGTVLEQPVLAALPALLVYFVSSHGATSRLRARARAVRSQVRTQLPFAADLLQLMLKAGASFQEALQTLVRQTRGSWLSTHLALVLKEIERGIIRAEALANLQVRLAMDEVQELVTVLRQADELGTPLTQILESQAFQLRHRQAQAIEKAAEQAKVKFTAPCTLIMIACMIAMLGPWVLKVLYDYQGILP